MKIINYNGPLKLVQSLVELNVPKNAHILDVCAGTGEVGVYLRKFGFNNIDALDGCIEMLNVARYYQIKKY
jgi:ubiquinone/menaquinone biosynthesis C-methylase UbiE